MPEYEQTNGDVAAELGAMIGLAPDINQRLILDGIFAESKAGRVACFEVGVCAPRQNIKSSTLEVATLTDLIVFREPLTLWTAHLTKTMRGAFTDMRDRIEASDELRRRFKKPREANGQESLELLTGEKIEFYSRSKGGGRGLTARRVVLDEALILDDSAVGALLPTMATQPNAQVRYGSSAGLSTSRVWRRVRDRGRGGISPRLAWYEWCSEKRDCADPKCRHKPGTPRCVYDDEKLWQQSNPTLGDRITRETMRDLRASMPPEEWAREFLGWWDDPLDDDSEDGDGISSDIWTSRTARGGDLAAIPEFALDVALDRGFTSIGVSGLRRDGRMQVELVEYGPGTTWAIDECKAMYAAWSKPVILAGNGPAAALIPELEAAGVPVHIVEPGDVGKACGSFADAVNSGTVAHLDDPVLTLAVQAARLRSGESFVFTRKGDIDISPLYAVALARWVAISQSQTGGFVSLSEV